MAMPEQFSLRWNDFHSNLSQSFHALLEGEDLVDVTLAAGGQYVHAHKLILSVCSPYFKELFKMNPCDHPIVILKDVAHQELRQLLQFMYRGEVHVRQQELSGFLHSAELLQVKGLTGGHERSESPPPVLEDTPKSKPVMPEPSSDSQQEWVPGGEDTIATETPAEPNVANTKEEAARSPLKRLLKNTPNKNSYNVKKKPRPATNDSPTHAENSDFSYDKVQNMVKWRSEGLMGNADMKDADKRKRSSYKLRICRVPNMAIWRTEGSIGNMDFKDIDNLPPSSTAEPIPNLDDLHRPDSPLSKHEAEPPTV
ncbi:unnamed protein product [Chilo suppressalis]|uniref:BTB domain-containing protein n=1 Tax=Chilo suppressalis TaxID=168631 RepID=A0ABN8LDH9_CHISP|nr:unnamed protein product [Chilo suppressalis]